jgi:hypothetical protein
LSQARCLEYKQYRLDQRQTTKFFLDAASIRDDAIALAVIAADSELIPTEGRSTTCLRRAGSGDIFTTIEPRGRC